MYQHELYEGVDVVKVESERLVAANVNDFRSYVDNTIQSESKKLIVDLSNVNFMDSSALGGMVNILKSMGAGGGVALVGVTGLVKDLFSLTRMDRIFMLVDDLPQAKTKLG